MKAAVLCEVGKPLEIEDIQIDKPGPREVLIRTAVAGVCHSDLHFVEGSYPVPLPTVLGHESCGVVEQVGSDVSYVEPGDHVITCLSVFCGSCEHCLGGHLSRCGGSATDRPHDAEPRMTRQGVGMHQFLHLSSFAEQMLVHEHAIVKIRKDMPMNRAAVIGCAVTTGLGAVFRTAAVEPGTDVAVIGCGGVGLSCINGAALAGAGRVIAVDRLGSKLELAKKFGASHTVNAGETDDVVGAVRELTSGGVHYSFEAIGLKVTTEQSFKMLRPGGTATVIGMIPVGTNIELHGPEFLQEKKIQGSLMGSNQFRLDMPRYVELYLNGRLELDALISDEIPLAGINDALDALKTGEVARQVIVFDS